MILSIDTCGTTGTLALGRWDGETASVMAQREMAGKTFCSELVPKVREMLQAYSSGVADLQAIVVASGPGSFTGVRIGLSSAKGLAEALKTPVIALSRLAILAHKGKADAAALDAGRNEYYFGSYKDEAMEELLTAEEVGLRAAEKIAVCEERLLKLWPSTLLVPTPDAGDALLFAAPRLRTANYDDLTLLDGNYVRRTDAELFARPKLQAALHP
jgi:tRNA threonylcarbamoyladenosine biosynthesis protein TsaB